MSSHIRWAKIQVEQSERRMSGFVVNQVREGMLRVKSIIKRLLNFKQNKASNIDKLMKDHVVALPDVVQIEVAMACNLKCPMCPVPAHMTHMDGRKANIMKPEVFSEIISQISDKPRTVGLTMMGEPFMNKHLASFVELAKSKGHVVSLTTNGTFLSEDRSRRLLIAGLDSLTVSFDGAKKDTYERIRVGANYDEVVSNTIRYKKLRDEINPESRLHVHCIISNLTRDEQEEFKLLWMGIADHITFLQLDDWVGQMELPPEFGFEPVPPGCASPPKKSVPAGCHLLWNTLSIGSNGSPVYCCFDYKLKSGLSHVFEKGIKETWNDEIAKERYKHMSNAVDSEPCMSCKHWARIKKAKEDFANLPADKGKSLPRRIFSKLGRLQ